MKIQDYKVIIGDNIEERVMTLVAEGYEPLGGVAIRHGSSSGHTYVQAMIKYYEE